jgi:hypothetical protein
MRTETMLLGLLLGGCAGGGGEPAAAGDTATDEPLPEIDAPEDDGPYLGESEDPEPPELDADAVAAAVESVLPTVIGAHAGHIRSAYAEALSGQSEGCPTWTQSAEGVPYWFDTCTADGGTRFEGYAYDLVSEDLADGEIVWDGWQFYGLATITGPDGATFEATGSAGVLTGLQSDGALVTYTYMDEGFRYDGPAADAAWLGAAGSPEVQAYTLHQPTTGGNLVSLQARASLDAGPITAVVFEDVQAGNAAAGAPCPAEPAGLISVRAEDGTWFELYFDGVPFDQWGTTEPTDCDGCASVWAKGSEVGEVCLDPSVLTDWGTAPWALEAPDTEE